MKKTLMILLTMLAVSACGSGLSKSLQGEWMLVSHSSGNVHVSAVSGVETNFTFEGNLLSGNVGCNSFGGEYEASGGTLEFGPIGATEMFCGGPIGEQESAVFLVLQGSARYTLEGNILVITSENGDLSIVLERK